MKLKEPSLTALFVILQEAQDWILPAEVIERYGDYKDWRNVVGTGPWILTDYIEGVSKSYIKNPDYWGFDEKYPGNRLPYSDQLRALLMPEEATPISALRTGQIDIIQHAGVVDAPPRRATAAYRIAHRRSEHTRGPDQSFAHPVRRSRDLATPRRSPLEPYGIVSCPSAIETRRRDSPRSGAAESPTRRWRRPVLPQTIVATSSRSRTQPSASLAPIGSSTCSGHRLRLATRSIAWSSSHYGNRLPAPGSIPLLQQFFLVCFYP